MKRFGNQKQNLSDGKEEEPRGNKTKRNLNGSNERRGGSPCRRRTYGDLSEADCAKKALLMFGDALPAEKSSATWTAGDSFSNAVIETPLVEDSTHDSI